VLLPLGSPLPADSVLALRGESGLLGRLSVPMSWGVAVPPDDYDHWAPKPAEGADADDEVTDGRNSEAPAEGKEERAEWQGEPEPRFEVKRTTGVVPHSPAAG
jgi:PPE-SVP subfamily C-terminal region